tara:strand:- start:6062 stop:7900 length:1839 start_codon:yes stop_codon:yes gene_type:complete
MAITREEAQANNIAIIDSETINTGQKHALIEQVKQLLPNVVNSDNIVNAQALQDLFDLTNTTSNNQGYELTFAGKGIAKKKADTETNKQLAIDKALSKNFETTKNVIIKGDNLDALKILKKNYHNQIKMIYIDPPYNTEQAFIYPDNFKTNEAELIKELGLTENTINYLTNTLGTNTHSKWLSFMYPRLLLARELLDDDGVIFISIDSKEQANLKLICDEVFGEENFITDFVWKKKKGGGNDSVHVAVEHESIIMFARSQKKLAKLFQTYSPEYLTRYDQEDEVSQYYWDTFKRKSGKQYYPIDCPDGTTLQYDTNGNEISWLRSEARFKSDLIIGDVRIFQKEDGSWSVRFKQRLPNGKKPRSILINESLLENSGTTSDGSNELLNLFGFDPFENPKPKKLISELIDIITSGDDYILDFFAGSGTTAHAVLERNKDDGGNRRLLLVQLEEAIEKKHKSYAFCQDNNLVPDITSITIERVNRAGNKLIEENPALKDKLDIGYRVLTLEDKPSVNQDDNGNFSFDLADKTSLNTLFNMLVATGKTLGNAIETIKEDTIYQVDNCIYILDKVASNEVEQFKKQQVYFDSMIDFDLEDYLNLDLQNKENIQVIFY